MKLRGVEFGNIFGASGSMNFFKDGWPYDKYFKFIPGYTMDGITHISKTATLLETIGNMPINKETLQPLDKLPDCIYVDFLRSFVLNAVELTNTGLDDLISRNIWQQMTKNFVISVMVIGKSLEQRIEEMKGIKTHLKRLIPDLKAKIAVEINESCPNVGHDTRKLAKESLLHFEIMDGLGVPLIAKFNLLIPIFLAVKLAHSGFCDAFSIPNTYPFYELPEKFRKKLFKNGISPLHNYGGGGYSGPWQTQLTAEWIWRARKADIELPIIAGSIYKRGDVRLMKEAGASAIAVGAVKIVRPWRLKGTKKEANKQFGGER
ncbi:MAG: hypothetical protein NT136_04060 [Candidatus Moranbacteria bacterium]|nr:hypothetical protein [Candidatus Moranbacteria bacterium]